ncbi:hypothetical protein AB1Y20_014729 [Prymnesium parvum]|uniref:EF-hand domain-containing protein n=1 Tax=Prymnesium parvum TaxID=97485 RepID=A0AB34IEG2_PRYPA
MDAPRVKLSQPRQKQLNQQKRATRVTNEMYFRTHPELRVMVSTFLTRLLEEKPSDIPQFASRYFTDKHLARKLGFIGWSLPQTPTDSEEDATQFLDGGAGEFEAPEEPAAATTGETVHALEQILVQLFQEADQNGDGHLDREEFAKLMETAELGLSEQEVQMLLAEADENADGQISYAEFVPVAVEVVQMIRLKASVDDVQAFEAEELHAAADFSAPADSLLREAVVKAAASDGTVSRSALKQALAAPSLGLNKQVIGLAADAAIKGAAVDAADLALEIRERVISAMAQLMSLQSLDRIGEELDSIFSKADEEKSGTLPRRTIKDVLGRNFPMLTRVQLNALVNHAPLDEAGVVLWRQYMPQLAMMLKAMLDPSTVGERAQLASRAEFLPVQLMNGRQREEMEAMLKALFEESDTNQDGYLDRDEYEECLVNADLGFTDPEINLLLDVFDGSTDGMLSYTEFADMAYDVLVHAAREKAIVDSMLNVGK